MSDRLDPFHVFLSCFSIASMAGIANLLRSDKPLSWRVCFSAAMYSGLAGLTIGLIWYNHFRETNIYFLIGVSGLAGLGGISLLDVVLRVIAKGGVNISIKPKGAKEGEDHD